MNLLSIFSLRDSSYRITAWADCIGCVTPPRFTMNESIWTLDTGFGPVGRISFFLGGNLIFIPVPLRRNKASEVKGKIIKQVTAFCF